MGSSGNERPWDSVRLNVAGGEPLLYRKETLAAVSFARDIGFDVSMITNGSLLDRTLLEELAPKLSLLGISVDSVQEGVNRGSAVQTNELERHSILMRWR